MSELKDRKISKYILLKGSIYTAAQAGPVLSSAWGWAQACTFLCPTWIRLESKVSRRCHCKCIICLLYFLTKAPFFTNSRQQVTYRWCWAQLSPTLELSWAWLASVSGRQSANTLSNTQPTHFCWCKWPLRVQLRQKDQLTHITHLW